MGTLLKKTIFTITVTSKIQANQMSTMNMKKSYPHNIFIKNNSRIQNHFNNYLIQMITFQQTEILQLLQRVKNILKNDKDNIQEIESNTNIYEASISNISRKIIDKDSSNCSFCEKIAVYADKDIKYYCWFHRFQFEEEL